MSLFLLRIKRAADSFSTKNRKTKDSISDRERKKGDPTFGAPRTSQFAVRTVRFLSVSEKTMGKWGEKIEITLFSVQKTACHARHPNFEVKSKEL